MADDSVPPISPAQKRANIIAQQAQREAAAPPIASTSSRRRRQRPNWTSFADKSRSSAAPERPAEAAAPETAPASAAAKPGRAGHQSK